MSGPWYRVPSWLCTVEPGTIAAKGDAWADLLRRWHLGERPHLRDLMRRWSWSGDRVERLALEAWAWAKENGAAHPADGPFLARRTKSDKSRTTTGQEPNNDRTPDDTDNADNQGAVGQSSDNDRTVIGQEPDAPRARVPYGDQREIQKEISQRREPDPTPDPGPTPDAGSDPDPWDAIEAQVTATREAEIDALATIPTPKPLPRPNRTLPGMKNGPPPRTPYPLPPLLRRDGDRGLPPAGSPDASSGDAGAPTGGDGGAGAPPTPSGDLPPGAGGHAAPALGAVLGPPVAAGVDDDTSPVRVGDRVLPGDLPALLSGMPSGPRVAIDLTRGGTLTTRALLMIRPDQLRYTKGLGKQGADNVVRHLAALGVEPGCLSPELEDERVWDQCLMGPPPQPGEPTPAYLRPRHLAALNVVGGRTGIRRANQFELNKLREKFLNHCKVAKP